MATNLSTAFSFAVCAIALICSGCTTTVTIPASELPELSTPKVDAMTDWPEVRTVDGKQEQIVGSIEFTRINTPTGNETVYPPYMARINGPYLEVFDIMGVRGYPLADKQTITIEYYDSKRTRGVVGGVLVGLGVPVLLFGGGAVATEVAASDSSDRSILIAGVTLVAAGLGLIIPGAVIAAKTPQKPSKWSTAHTPNLHIGPHGARMTIPF